MFLGTSGAISLAGVFVALAGEFVASTDAVTVTGFGSGLDRYQGHSALQDLKITRGAFSVPLKRTYVMVLTLRFCVAKNAPQDDRRSLESLLGTGGRHESQRYIEERRERNRLSLQVL
jgi:hypothetical protein